MVQEPPSLIWAQDLALQYDVMCCWNATTKKWAAARTHVVQSVPGARFLFLEYDIHSFSSNGSSNVLAGPGFFFFFLSLLQPLVKFPEAAAAPPEVGSVFSLWFQIGTHECIWLGWRFYNLQIPRSCLLWDCQFSQLSCGRRPGIWCRLGWRRKHHSRAQHIIKKKKKVHGISV